MTWARAPDVTTYLRDAVKANAAPNGAFRWDVQTAGSPPLSEMKKYDIVLWLSGEQYQNTITAADQQNLQQYLAGGGNLIVSGQDIGYDIGESNFYRGTLKTQFVADSSGTTRFVTSGVLGNVGYDLNTDGSAKDQVYPDVIADIGGGVVAGSWGSAGATAGTIQAQSIGADNNKARAQVKSGKPRGLIEQVATSVLRQLVGQAGNGKPVKQPSVRAQSAGQDAGAIVLNDGGRYRTATFGFGLEGLSPDARSLLLKSTFNWLMR